MNHERKKEKRREVNKKRERKLENKNLTRIYNNPKLLKNEIEVLKEKKATDLITTAEEARLADLLQKMNALDESSEILRQAQNEAKLKEQNNFVFVEGRKVRIGGTGDVPLPPTLPSGSFPKATMQEKLRFINLPDDYISPPPPKTKEYLTLQPIPEPPAFSKVPKAPRVIPEPPATQQYQFESGSKIENSKNFDIESDTGAIHGNVEVRAVVDIEKVLKEKTNNIRKRKIEMAEEKEYQRFMGSIENLG
eukprot:augustus_masked-scaffold_9-processed-gene-2.17-mRNA-1 protein AED:1.00 eAED:1.00 QI:0/-1/0/0/-1/1/1/0/249